MRLTKVIYGKGGLVSLPWFLCAQVCLALCFFISKGVFAAAIGLPDHVDRFAIAPALSSVQVDDDRGKTEREVLFQPINLVYIREELLTKRRYWAEAYFHRASFDASAGKLGVTVEQLGLRLSVQRALNVSMLPEGSLYAGGGMQLAYNRYKKRHMVDSSGFLTTRYDDKNKLEQSLLLNIVYEQNFDARWSGGVKLEHVLPINEDINKTSLSLILFF